MSNIIYKTDTKIILNNIEQSNVLLNAWSPYVNIAHPGTNKTIIGWQYDSRFWPAEDTDYPTSAPFVSDADLSGLPKTNFQSGIGSLTDCLIDKLDVIKKSGFIENWCPVVNHGYYYDYNNEYYLYSSAVRSQTVNVADVSSSVNFAQLSEESKETTPILARVYQWDSAESKYKIYKNFNKKRYFTGSRSTPTSARLPTWNQQTQQILYSNIDSSKNEFVLTSDGINPFKLIFNKIVTTQIGITVSTIADLASLEVIGSSDGSIKQLFHTKYSPLEKNQTITVYSYIVGGSTYQSWTPRLNTSLTHSGFECMVDTDMGTIQFGDTALGDQIPIPGSTIVVRYTSSVDVKYEPKYSQDNFIALNKEANTNPLVRNSNRGFLMIKNQEFQIGNILLYTDLPLVSANTYYPLDIGNIFTRVHALVTNKIGEPIDSLKVNFTLLDTPFTGLFSNGAGIASAYTNDDGIATTLYIPPKSIDDIGEYILAAGYSTSGGNTTLTTQNLKVSPNVSQIYLYKVWKDDPTQGISIGDNTSLNNGLITSELDTWYKDNFFTPEGIFGPTGIDPLTGNPYGDLLSGATMWETKHRILTKLLTPVSYNRLFRNGRKQIVSVWSATALDPHFDLSGAFIPLKPNTISSVTNIQNKVTYNGVVLDAPGTGDLDAYYLISPPEFRIQANVYDEEIDKVIYSNIITIKLHIPDSLNGTVSITDINNLPSTIVPYLLNSGDNGKILPLGFKLRQSGNTFASAIQGVTYIDINEPAELNMTFNVHTII